MTDRSQASSGRDFGFQTSDQAGATSQQHPQHAYGQYNADQNTNAPGVAENPLPAHLQDPSMRYQDFGLPQQQPAPGQYSGYSFSPSAALGWDWSNSIDFAEFTNQYEPQGELVGEIQQPLDANDFSIPLPVTTVDSVYQTPHASNVVTPNAGNAQNPLSPPPKPPQRPVVQTGMKRKAESEPDSAVSQTTSAHPESQQNLAKRPNKSRQSSTNSLPSPVVAASTETRQSPMAQTVVAHSAPETAQGNLEVARRKDQSKGTGPQGRVIDVSKPRRVVESPGGSDILPAGKVFPIQIGSELFRLSGASISSDGKHSPCDRVFQSCQLRLLEHPHISRISSANSFTTTAVVLVT